LTPNPLGGFLIITGILLLFGILNYTEIWYREKFYYCGEHLVVLKFHDSGSESEVVRIYEEDSHITHTLDEILLRSAEISNFTDENFFELICDVAGIQRNEEVEKKARKVLTEKFGSFYVHEKYFKYYFLNLDFEEIELHSYIKAFIISRRERLPRDMFLTCALLREQKIKGKKHTVIVAFEGILDDELATKMNAFSTDMEFFKLTSQFADTTQMEQELRYYKSKVETLVEAFEDLAKQDLTINSKVAYYRPARQNVYKKRKWRREE